MAYPKGVTSMSCSNALVETTMSQMLISVLSEPATPVLTKALTPNTLTSICAQMAALTLPTPHFTTTTSLPARVPL